MSEKQDNSAGDSDRIIQLKQVGIVSNRNEVTNWDESWGNLSWQEKTGKMKEQQQAVSELVIDTDLEGILDGIDGFSHLLVLYWAHLGPIEKRSLTRVHPMGRQDFPLTGIFATQSPVRPNPILATVVKLIEHEGNILRVMGLDAMDGSPIMDIKPYTGSLKVAETIKIPDWIRRIQQEFK
jgi:tRNA-Thr(GGU) m(6)t(6)A37 methyltransferase TsaA